MMDMGGMRSGLGLVGALVVIVLVLAPVRMLLIEGQHTVEAHVSIRTV